MPTSEKKRMQAGNTVHIDSHAVATLRYIRASMDAAASLPVPGSSALAAGVVGLFAAVITSIPSVHEHWFAVWIAAAFVAASIGIVLLLRHSPADALTIAGSPVRKFAVCFLPSMAAGVVLTGVHRSYGNLDVIPATWLILYGCALIAASAATTRLMGYVGAGFFGLGILALFAPPELHICLLGVGFGALHIVLGYLIGRAEARSSRNLVRGRDTSTNEEA